jgi:hypothetical protein
VSQSGPWDRPSFDMSNLSNKFYIARFVLLFVISSVILLIASTARSPLPAWGGYQDVTIVVLIALAGFTIYRRSKNVLPYDVSYQVALYLLPLILVGRWVYRASLDFNILLPGVAWRTCFFLSILPHALYLFGKSELH